MNAAAPRKVVDLSGFGFSGKAAVIDLFREFRGYYVPDAEFEFALLRIQGGILDLETALCEDWSPVRSDAAIRRFKRLVRRLGEKNRLLNPRSWFAAMGWNYEDVFAHRFFALSDTYVRQLVSASWRGSWPFPMADVCEHELFVRKLLRRLGVRRAYDFEVYLACPEDFVGITREYLSALLSSNVGPDVTAIVLHNAFEPFHPQRALRFFADARAVIVDRDPRDSYVQQRPHRHMGVPVEEFILRYRTYRRAARRFEDGDARVLRLRFENLVREYEQHVACVLAHLGETADVHVEPRRYFDPAVSSKNVGLWRTYPRQDEIERIQRELREYCVD